MCLNVTHRRLQGLCIQPGSLRIESSHSLLVMLQKQLNSQELEPFLNFRFGLGRGGFVSSGHTHPWRAWVGTSSTSYSPGVTSTSTCRVEPWC